TITVEIFGDNRIEPDEQFYVNLLSAENGQIAANPAVESNHVTIQIDNDDTVANADYGPYSIRFSDTIYVVQEPDSGTAFAEVTILRTPDSSYAIAVLSTYNGTATAPQDYTPVFRELVVFGPNEHSRTVLVPIHADDAVEGPETILLDLRDPTGDLVNGEPNRARIVITDDDTPAVIIDPPKFLSPVWGFEIFGIKEGSGGVSTPKEFTVRLRDNALAPPGG